MSYALTLKQETFCQEYLKSRNASDAYRKAYCTDNMKPESVWRKAKELLDNGKVTARLVSLSAKVEEKLVERFVADREDVLWELWDNAQRAKAAVPVTDKDGTAVGVYQANIAASNQALIAYGKERFGGFIDRKEVKLSPLEAASDEEVLARGRAAAERLGVEFPKVTLQ